MFSSGAMLGADRSLRWRASRRPSACRACRSSRLLRQRGVRAHTGKEPFLTLDALQMAKHKMFFSSAKAERELGYTAAPLGRRHDALAWFRDAGY